jgi:uncharacterized protein YjdB
MKFLFSSRFYSFLLAQLLLIGILSAQQVPSIQTGVTFQWATNPQGANNAPSFINSITINGVVNNLFVVPTSYTMTQLGPNGHGQNDIMQNGVTIFNNSAAPGWPAAALAAFQSRNLNYYFTSSSNGQNVCNNFPAIPTTSAQKQSLNYSPGIPSNNGGFVAITERGGNNCYHIAVFGTPAGGGPVQQLGQTFVRDGGNNSNGQVFGPPPANSDYWRSGRSNENGQTICIALFPLANLAPTGSIITRVQLTAATADHGDGKFFILQKYANADNDTIVINNTYNGNVATNDNAPVGSTFSLVSGLSPNNGTLTFNTNGTYTVTSNNGFVGTMTFVYQLCLPAPNNTVCDQATVTLIVMPDAGPDRTACVNGSATMAAVGNGTWAAVSGNPGTSTITNATNRNTTITSFSAPGTYRYTWSQSGLFDTVSIVVSPLPTLGGATAVCVGGIANVTPVTGGTWTSSNTSVATITNSGVVTGVSAGTSTLTFTETATGCSSTRSFTVNALPSIGGATSVCVGATANVTPATGGTWSSSNTSFATITNAGLVTGISAGTLILTFTETATGCTNTVSFTVNACGCATPPTANISGANDACLGSPVTLTGTFTNASSATWSIVSGGGSLSTTMCGSSPCTTVYTPSTTGTAVIRLTTNDPDGVGPCTAAQDEQTIIIRTVPSLGPIQRN